MLKLTTNKNLVRIQTDEGVIEIVASIGDNYDADNYEPTYFITLNTAADVEFGEIDEDNTQIILNGQLQEAKTQLEFADVSSNPFEDIVSQLQGGSDSLESAISKL